MKKIMKLVLAICMGITLTACKEENLLKLKENEKVLEYGEVYQPRLQDILDVTGLSEEEISDIESHAKIESNIVYVEEKDYAKVGEYEFTITYNDEEVKQKVIVKDTVAPMIENKKIVMSVDETKDNNHILESLNISDLSSTCVVVDYDKISFGKSGTYQTTVTVSDESKNETKENIEIHIQKVELKLNTTSIELEKDKTYTLKSTIKNTQDKCTYESKDKSIAKVDQTGKITGLKEGNTVIVVKVKDQVQECKVKVFAKKQITPPVTDKPSKEYVFVEHNVPFINQFPMAPMGCEGAALLQCLQGKGYAKGVSLKTFLDNQPYTNDNNPHHGYCGSPYKNLGDDSLRSIFPDTLAPYGNQYGPCKNAMGYSVNQLIDELKKGNTALVHVTYKFASPKVVTYSFGNFVSNGHVVSLIGYDEKNDQVKIMDPAGVYSKMTKTGSYWISMAKFKKAYNALNYAIVVS